MIKPNTALMACGDLHMQRPLSAYRVYVPGFGNIIQDESDRVHLQLRSFMDEQNMRVLHVGDMVTDGGLTEEEINLHHVFFDTRREDDIEAMGNHDNKGILPENILPENLRLHENTFEYGYKGRGTIWAKEIVDDRVMVIVLHNIQDVLEAGLWQYEDVNPAGGYADHDWGGIATAASPQRQFFTAALSEADMNNYHVIVLGHRSACSLSPITIRPNHTEALATGGYIKELEDWAVATGRNPILITGDVHSYSLTDPIVAGAASDRGVIHLVVSAGPVCRNLVGAPLSYHRSYIAGDPGSSAVSDPPLFDLSTDISWVENQQLISLVELKWYDRYLAIETYIILAPWMETTYPGTKLPRRAFMVDRFQADIINGKLTGLLRRCLPCAESLRVL